MLLSRSRICCHDSVTSDNRDKLLTTKIIYDKEKWYSRMWLLMDFITESCLCIGPNDMCDSCVLVLDVNYSLSVL